MLKFLGKIFIGPGTTGDKKMDKTYKQLCPEAIILRRAMKLKLIAIFFGVVTVAIILIGYLFNILQEIFI